MKRIAVDMDEVLAKYTKKVIETLKMETGYLVDPDLIVGQYLSKSLPEEYVKIVTSYPHRSGFFRDLEIMEDSQDVLLKLMDHYEIYIVSATMQHANAPKDKLLWLQDHFPFIDFRNIVFCDNKSIIRADYLIDDHPRHLETFHGKPILFSAFHNIHEHRFERANNWKEIENLLKASS